MAEFFIFVTFNLHCPELRYFPWGSFESWGLFVRHDLGGGGLFEGGGLIESLRHSFFVLESD